MEASQSLMNHLGQGVYTFRGGYRPGHVWKRFHPGMEPGNTLAAHWVNEPCQSEISLRGRGFYILQGGFDPEGVRFRLGVVGSLVIDL